MATSVKATQRLLLLLAAWGALAHSSEVPAHLITPCHRSRACPRAFSVLAVEIDSKVPLAVSYDSREARELVGSPLAGNVSWLVRARFVVWIPAPTSRWRCEMTQDDSQYLRAAYRHRHVRR